jgi:hypothetical protein
LKSAKLCGIVCLGSEATVRIVGLVLASLLSVLLLAVVGFVALGLNSMTGCVGVSAQECLLDIAANDTRWAFVVGPLISAVFVAPLLLKRVPGLKQYWVRLLAGGLIGGAVAFVPMATYSVPESSVVRFCEAGRPSACNALQEISPAKARELCERGKFHACQI